MSKPPVGYISFNSIFLSVSTGLPVGDVQITVGELVSEAASAPGRR